MSLTQALATYFRARPNVWIDGRDLEFAGRYAWRSRVSDCRQLGMRIDNRQRRHRRVDGTSHITSEYRFVVETTSEVADRKKPETTAIASGLLF
jgi:hypothetical protein